MYTTKSHYSIMPKAIGGLIEDVFQNGFQKVFGDENWNEGINVPVNIRETESVYEMHLMAPGMKKDKFMINVERNVLHVSYDDKQEATEEQVNERTDHSGNIAILRASGSLVEEATDVKKIISISNSFL